MASTQLEQDVLLHLTDVKQLYTEFFMLMLQSAQEDPADGRPSVDGAIATLMGTIEDHMNNFRHSIELAGGTQALSGEISEAVVRFNDNLREGLQNMHKRLTQRTLELRARRDDIKDKLTRIKSKSKATRGYRQKSSRPGFVRSQA